jgi:hypothetical protein
MTVKHYSIKDYTWQVKKTAKKRRVRSIAAPEWALRGFLEPSQYVELDYTADFSIDIDIDSIVRDIVSRAMSNKTGRAKLLNGYIKAVRSNVRESNVKVTDVPLKEGYIEVQS